MPNTKSPKKAIRSSSRKRDDNLAWKKRYKTAAKTLDDIFADKGTKAEQTVVTENLRVLQKLLDKAALKKAIHVNKANRLKSKYATKATAFFATPVKSSTKKTK